MTLTDAAAERLRWLYAKAEQGKLLRIGVKTKGCSGMSYDMTWVDEPGPGDEVVTDKGLTVLVDRKASLFLIGTVMDYEVKAPDLRLHLHQPEREGPLRLRRELPRLSLSARVLTAPALVWLLVGSARARSTWSCVCGSTTRRRSITHGGKTTTLSIRADQRN